MVAAAFKINGQRFVILPEGEYEALVSRRNADGEPDLPALAKPLANGNDDAVAYARASLARKIIRDRRAAGLSQAELARRAGIRIETLNRIERLKLTPSVATVEKIDRGLAAKS
jgi:ribosome-binding protein aMBF1 (putative translation factor)